jgi:hypothetical protein
MLCACVFARARACVCVRERERERERFGLCVGDWLSGRVRSFDLAFNKIVLETNALHN